MVSSTLPQSQIQEEETDNLQEYIKVFMRLFQGREDCFAVQTEQGGYYPKYYPIRPIEIQEHLFRCVMTYGVYLLRSDNTVMFAVIDIDIDPQKLTEVENKEGIGAGARLDAIAKSEAKKQSELLTNKFHLPNIIEFSGKKGYHIIFFFKNPIPAYFLLKLHDQLVLKRNPEITSNAHLNDYYEFFPKQAYASGKGIGNLIKMPLGKHQVSRKYSYLLNPNTMEELFDALPFLVNVDKQYRIKGQYLEELVGEKMVYEVPKPASEHKSGSHGHLRSRFDFDIPSEESIKNVIVEIETLLNHDPKNGDGSYNFANINKCPPCMFEAYLRSKTLKGQFESRAILVRYLANVKRTYGNFGFTPEEIAGFIQYRINDDEDRLHPEKLKYYTAYFYGDLEEPNQMDKCETLQRKGFCLNYDFKPIDPKLLNEINQFKESIDRHIEYRKDIIVWQHDFEETHDPMYLDGITEITKECKKIEENAKNSFENLKQHYNILCERFWHPFDSNNAFEKLNPLSIPIPIKIIVTNDTETPNIIVEFDYKNEQRKQITNSTLIINNFIKDPIHNTLFFPYPTDTFKSNGTLEALVSYFNQNSNFIVEWFVDQKDSKPFGYLDDVIVPKTKKNLYFPFRSKKNSLSEMEEKHHLPCYLPEEWLKNNKMNKKFSLKDLERIQNWLTNHCHCEMSDDTYHIQMKSKWFDPKNQCFIYDCTTKQYICKFKRTGCWFYQLETIRNNYLMQNRLKSTTLPQLNIFNYRHFEVIRNIVRSNDYIIPDLIVCDENPPPYTSIEIDYEERHHPECPISIDSKIDLIKGNIGLTHGYIAKVQISINLNEDQEDYSRKYMENYSDLEDINLAIKVPNSKIKLYAYLTTTLKMWKEKKWKEAYSNKNMTIIYQKLLDLGLLTIVKPNFYDFPKDQKIIYLSATSSKKWISHVLDREESDIIEAQSDAFNNNKYLNPFLSINSYNWHGKQWGIKSIHDIAFNNLEIHKGYGYRHPLILMKKTNLLLKHPITEATITEFCDSMWGKNQYSLVTYPSNGRNDKYKSKENDGNGKPIWIIDCVIVLGRFGLDDFNRMIYEDLGLDTTNYDIDAQKQAIGRGRLNLNNKIPIFSFADRGIDQFFQNPVSVGYENWVKINNLPLEAFADSNSFFKAMYLASNKHFKREMSDKLYAFFKSISKYNYANL